MVVFNGVVTYFYNSSGYLSPVSPELECTLPQTSSLEVGAIKCSFQCFCLHG